MSKPPSSETPEFVQRLPAPLRAIALWPRQLYVWMMKIAAGPNAEKGLAAISFAESSFFPIPPDLMMAPMILARPDRAYRYALVCTIASVFGALFGYAIGYFFTPVGLMILNFLGYGERLADFHDFMEKWGVWVILGKGLTPIPFKLVTIASGIAHMALLPFFVSCAVTRGARFFAVAWACKRFGPQITEQLEKRFYLVGTVLVVLIVLGIVAIKLIPH
ncbi:YqaA family protein [Asticcacaulis sp. AC402]|uniref:YqaA family protein n=1 Tax=Asticcacaulis sp. AC402 TaxID=1282361 RepID=UPI0003C3D901|nr:YqaA family protein [Asticcacaulis sp. AC402]ESQ76665.1 cytochrome B561 [Asticcacaulis sp. AC402]